MVHDEQATKCISIGNRPLIHIAGDFNGADLSPLGRALQVYKIKKEPTHINGSILDLILTNAPKCYTTEMHEPLMSFNGIKSDDKTIIAFARKLDYKKELPRQDK